MSTKGEFYVALDHLKEAAKAARRAMPEDFRGRERNVWTALLERLPEQIDDLRSSLDDPYTVTPEGLRQRERNKLIIP